MRNVVSYWGGRMFVSKFHCASRNGFYVGDS